MTAYDPVHRAGGNLAGIARWAAQTYGDRPALEHENGEAYTFVELAGRVAHLSELLRSAGVGVGDRVAVALHSEPAAPLLVLAAANLGAAVQPLNPGFRPAEVEHLVDLVQPTHAVAVAEFWQEHASLLNDRGVRRVDLTAGTADVTRLGTLAAADRPVRFGLTSGSTGMPKAVTKTHGNWLHDGRALATVLELSPGDRVLSSQPLYYGDPFMLLMGCLQSGATAVLLSRFRSQTFMEQVGRRRITKFLTIGAMPAMLLNTPPAPHDRDHGALAAWSVGVPRELHAQLEDRFGVPWLELYGTAECGGVLGQRLGEPRSVAAGWLGSPTPDTRLRLVDEASGEIIDGDGTGLVEVHGPTVAQGYWGIDGTEAAAFRPGGWYRTGDILERAGTRYRYVRRHKDVVRRAGENISCREVEVAVRESPGVVDVAVVPRPDSVRGEEVWAFIQPTEVVGEGRAALAERITDAAARQLARHKVPRFVTFVERFPRTPTERIIKRRLVESVAEDDIVDLGERRRPVGSG